MEIIKSRYGLERTIEKFGTDKLRVMGESQFVRQSEDSDGNITMFDFEGGPILSVGGEFSYQKLKWVITHIQPETSKHEELSECVLTVKAKY